MTLFPLTFWDYYSPKLWRVFLTSKDILLCANNTSDLKKLILIHYCHRTPKYVKCCDHILAANDLVQNHRLRVSSFFDLNASLIFLWLRVLVTFQDCRPVISQHLFVQARLLFLQLRFRLRIFRRRKADDALFSVPHITWCKAAIFPITGDINVAPFIRVISVRLLSSRVTSFLFVINKYFCVKKWKLSYSSINF